MTTTRLTQVPQPIQSPWVGVLPTCSHMLRVDAQQSAALRARIHCLPRAHTIAAFINVSARCVWCRSVIAQHAVCDRPLPLPPPPPPDHRRNYQLPTTSYHHHTATAATTTPNSISNTTATTISNHNHDKHQDSKIVAELASVVAKK